MQQAMFTARLTGGGLTDWWPPASSHSLRSLPGLTPFTNSYTENSSSFLTTSSSQPLSSGAAGAFSISENEEKSQTR